ncbi:8-amino-7-oxononanoate synthase [Sulfuriroseicoccus oceanibius]|uniref:8-amino-7-oxononanoate synthase n=2 Tax=Sulfuriroseicoccus oceanibius TaxID=2707525 RepID=A0A6B3LA12_9BACT|nr:8-amino-7-oxononanoate synthase [Sulfuriroseicoccus oceanibius]
MASPQGRSLTPQGGRPMVNFASNDYLGLATHPTLKCAASDAADRWGTGSGASRLVCGTLLPHVTLESRLAEFKQAEAALTFSSGYACAVGTLGALAGKDDILILDKLCHASLVDGARLCGATLRVFPHNHLDKLESHLKWAQSKIQANGRIIVAVESIYSMDGDTAPLEAIVTLKEQYKALLLVDEAHSIGICGPGGRGLAAALGVASSIDFQMGTLSKALGGSGGYLCASRKWIDLLINRARSFIYSTAPSPISAAVATAAIDLVDSEEGDTLRSQLQSNITRLRALTGNSELTGPSAIVPLIVGESDAALSLSDALAKRGILAPAIRYPTVPKGSARIRFTTTTAHTDEDFVLLQDALTCR